MYRCYKPWKVLVTLWEGPVSLRRQICKTKEEFGLTVMLFPDCRDLLGQRRLYPFYVAFLVL